MFRRLHVGRESVERDFGERCHAEAGVRKIVVMCRGIRRDDNEKARASGGFTARRGILEGDGFVRSGAKCRQSGKVDLGLGFAMGDVVAAADDIK